MINASAVRLPLLSALLVLGALVLPAGASAADAAAAGCEPTDTACLSKAATEPAPAADPSGTDGSGDTASGSGGDTTGEPDDGTSTDDGTTTGSGEDTTTTGGTDETTGGQETDQDQTGSGGVQQNDSQSDPSGEVNQTATTGRTPDDLDCRADFDTQNAAQEVLDNDINDPFILDANNNGVACENLGRRFRRVVFTRVRRVELARTGPHALWIGLSGGLCLLGGMALRRRGGVSA